jgi:cytidine deaminase
MTEVLSDVESSLVQSAKEVSQRAYAPASHFHVGCAVLTATGSVFTGCNVENASFGLTICAERAAIAAAVAAEGPRPRIAVVAVYTPTSSTCTPCGACRQVIAEFGSDTTVLFLLNGEYVRRTVEDLLPDTFELPQRK